MTRLLPWPMTLLLILFIGYFFLGRAMDCGGNHVVNTITVDQQGKGAFKTIQAAIDSIKTQNDQWIMVHINPGVYREKVHIPIEKPCIILQGSGSSTTIITYNDSFHTNGTSMSATFISYPPNVVVSDITFKNTFGDDGQAVAATIYGDKSAIFKSSFYGYQDTLLPSKGRHYFKNCYIQGEVDFICGGGQSYFESCVMNATQGRSRHPGYVTAQFRNSPDATNGFVFRGGHVVGTGKVNLGRPWGPYARVIFLETDISSVVTPQGWNA